MSHPSVEQFMLEVKKQQESSSSKKTRSLMKLFDILLCCKLCGEEVYKLEEDVDFQTCNEDLSDVFNEHFRNGKQNKCCRRLNLNESYVEKMMMANRKYERKQLNPASSQLEK